VTKENDQLGRIETKLDVLDEKITQHLIKVSVLEEKQKTDRGAIVLLFSIFMTVIGYIVYKVKFSL